MQVEIQAEVHETANESLQLAVLGVGSMALVLALAFALLGGDVGFSTSGSIEAASRLVVGCLLGTAAALFAVSAKRRPARFAVTASRGGLLLDGKRRVAATALRNVVVLPAGKTWAVELESRATVYRLLLEDRDRAERFAGALLGKDRLPAALARTRQRASYYVFVATISIWILVYGAICALPQAPIVGGLLLTLFLPLAIWITLRALPAQVIAWEDRLLFLHPLSTVSYSSHELDRVVIADDDCIELVLGSGMNRRLPDLVNHPRDGRNHFSVASPAERLALVFQGGEVQAA